MFCTKCGAELTEKSRFCEKCGAPIEVEDEKGENEVVKENISENSYSSNNTLSDPEIDISMGEGWRWRWAAHLNTIIRMAYIKVVLLWITVLPISSTYLQENLGGVYVGDDEAFFGIVMLVIIVVLVVVSYIMVESAKNKVAREQVMLQQAEDIRYLAEYVKKENREKEK